MCTGFINTSLICVRIYLLKKSKTAHQENTYKNVSGGHFRGHTKRRHNIIVDPLYLPE